MSKPRFMCDFETTTNPDDCRVWCWGAMEIGNESNYVTGLDIESFIDFAEKTQGINYFHNAKFDFEFVLPQLKIRGYVQENKTSQNKSVSPKTFDLMRNTHNLVYNLSVTIDFTKRGEKIGYKLIDSLKIFPYSASDIGKAFKLGVEKTSINYEKERPKGYQPTTEEWQYLKNDILIICRALEVNFKQGLVKTTASSNAFNDFKPTLVDKALKEGKLTHEKIIEKGLSEIGKSVDLSPKGFEKIEDKGRKYYEKVYFETLFPVLNEPFVYKDDPKKILKKEQTIDDFFRESYRGGFTWVNDKFKGVEIGEGSVYDVNSLYPYQMYTKPLPYGVPKHYKGEYVEDKEYPLFIQQVSLQFKIKEDKIPCIQIKKDMRFGENEYLKSSNGDDVILYVTNVDLELIKEHYDLDHVEYIQGFKFKCMTDIFTLYIDKWNKIKMDNEGVLRNIAKLMSNSLYGKFGTSVYTTKMLYDLNEKGIGFYTKPDEDDFCEPVYTPLAVFVTAYGRSQTISTAQKIGLERIIYVDTDSAHIVGLDVPETLENEIDSKILGKWKHEYDFKKAKYIRQKTYVDVAYCNKYVEDGEIKEKECPKEKANSETLVVKCAGMPDRIKEKVTFENFEVGFKSYGKLVPKRVKNGVVLVDTEFTIK